MLRDGARISQLGYAREATHRAGPPSSLPGPPQIPPVTDENRTTKPVNPTSGIPATWYPHTH